MKEHPIHTQYLISEYGEVYKKTTGRKLKPILSSFGYIKVSIKTNYGKWIQSSVHRLVAQTYLSNPYNKREVNHIDCDKTNNHVSNLEWVSSKENKAHAWDNGLYTMIGEKHIHSIFTDEQVHLMCKMMEDGMTNKDIAAMFSAKKDTISNIRSGRMWTHISCKYNIKKKRVERKSKNTVLKIAEMLKQKISPKEISEITKMKVSEILRIKNREIFSSITSEFNF